MEQTNKVVLFTSSCLSMPTVDFLLQSKLLVAVVFVAHENVQVQSESEQLRVQCEAFNIAFVAWNSDAQLLAQLDQWQATMAISCVTAAPLSDTIINFFHGHAYGVFLQTDANYQWVETLYWQVRTQQDDLSITVQRLTGNGENQAQTLQQNIAIHPFDTYQSLAMRVASTLAQTLALFFAEFKQLNWQPHSAKECVLPALTYNDLTLSCVAHSASDFVAAARAGNPLYGGFILTTKLGEINVLQASFVEEKLFFEPAGTILTISKSAGLVVQTKQGAVALDIVSCQFGCVTGYRFASLANISAGMQL